MLLIYPGKVFEGELVEKHDEPGRVVAVKICHVTNKVRHSLLLHEACALSILKGTDRVFRLLPMHSNVC